MKAQDWLKENYSQEAAGRLYRLYIDRQLEGELDLTEFPKLEKIFISHRIDQSKFKIENQNSSVEIIDKLVNTREWIENQKEYNTKEKRGQITEMNVEEKNLEGELDLSDFVNLKELNCDSNVLTSLKVTNCRSIEKISAQSNQIKVVVGIEELVNLEELSIGHNKLEGLKITKNTKLRNLFCPENPITSVIIGKDNCLSFYSGGKGRLSHEEEIKEVNNQDLIEVAKELGITAEQVEGASKEEIKKLIKTKVDKLLNNQTPVGLPADWKNKIKDLETTQSSLEKWTNKFKGKNPDQVAKEIEEAKKSKSLWDKVKDTLFSGETIETAVKELKDWQARFPGKKPAEIEQEIKELKSKPAGAVLTPQQQQKLNDYDALLGQKNALEKQKQLLIDLGKYLKQRGLTDTVLSGELRAQVLQVLK